MSLGKTACGMVVHVTYNSYQDVPVFFVKEAIKKISNPDSDAGMEVSFDSDIGLASVTETSDNDVIIYVKRPRTEGYSRVVKGKGAKPSNKLTLVLRRVSMRELVLVNSWIGEKRPPEPWGVNKTLESLAYWSTHAYVWGQFQMIPGSETERCPW
jgi:hypothetical protein